MTKKQEIDRLSHFLYEVGTLRKIPRAHMQALLTNDLSDNIASHSFRVAIIGWFLAISEGADPYKVLLMCLFHDTGETRSGDQNWIQKRYVKVFEDEITADQFSGLTGENELLKMHKEYEERKTKEAKLAKAADVLDQILLLKEYDQQGNSEAFRWLGGGQQEEKLKELETKFGYKLAQAVVKQKPHSWWKNIWTSKRR